MAKKKSIGLPGGPNEYITDISEFVSIEGYKYYSDDVDNPLNIIESGSITMEDVEFPVLGTDNLGNSQIMQPGMTYEFPGNMVFEIPLSQNGGERNVYSQMDKWNENVLNEEQINSNQGFDLSGWLRGEQGWVPDYKGQSTSQLTANFLKDLESDVSSNLGGMQSVPPLTDDQIEFNRQLDEINEWVGDDFTGEFKFSEKERRKREEELQLSPLGQKVREYDSKYGFTGEWGDALRHSYSSAQVSKKIKDRIKNSKFGNFFEAIGIDDIAGFVGTNLLGLGHEASVLPKDNRPWEIKLEESLEDIYNNYKGSIVDTNMSDEDIYQELIRQANSGELKAGKVENPDSQFRKLTQKKQLGGMNVPLKTVNKFGELERLTYPSSVWKDKEGNPQEVSLLDEVVVDYKGPIALAKEQMEEYGIADFLKAGYVKGKSERAYNNIVPEGYGNVAKNLDRVRRYRGDLGRDPEALWHSGPKDNKRHYTIPNREDAFRLYLGMPQVNNSFSVSDYRPGDSKDKSMVYLKPTYFNDEKIRQALVDQYYREVDDEDIKLGDKDIGNERGLPRGQWQGDGTPWPSHDNSLGDFTFHMGEDEKGTYISIYDIWDLNPFQPGKGSSVNKAADQLLEYVTSLGKKVTSKSEVSDIFEAGKPFEVYERIYIDPETRKIIQMKQGGSLVKLDQLTNFTNYNTPQPGGWLDKY